MLENITLIIITLGAGVLLYAAMQPDTFCVERSIVINAAPNKVFAQINDLHNWQGWSAWEKKDPNMKKTHSGAAQGVGAIYAWDGDKNVGKGSMTISESIPNSKVQIKLDFVTPMEGHNMADMVLQPQDSGTQVVWSMYGPSPYIAKLFGVFVNMDQMIGKDFENSLAGLKRVSEQNQDRESKP